MTALKSAVKPKPNLREAQKEFTRQRILESARELFYHQGYHQTTIDHIVAQAGASRQTFYHHFADKDAILAILIAGYSENGSAVMRRLPGPLPSRDELIAWLRDIADFFENEKATRAVLGEISARPAPNAHKAQFTPEIGKTTIDIWIQALATRAQPFATAVSAADNAVDALAHARMLILQMIWACSLAWEQRGSRLADATLAVLANALHDFLHDPAYHSADTP